MTFNPSDQPTSEARRPWCGLIRLVLLCAVVAPTEAVADEFRVLYEKATLEIEKQAFPRLRVESRWSPEISLGEMRYRVDGDTVVRVDGTTHRVTAQARAPDGAGLKWEGAIADVAFFVGQPPARGRGFQQIPVPPPVVRRLNLKLMEWPAPLEIELQPPADSQALKEREAAARHAMEAFAKRFRKAGDNATKLERGPGLVDVLVDKPGTFVFSYLGLGIEGFPREPLGFQMTFIPAGEEKPAWHHWIDMPEGPQGHVLSSSGPFPPEWSRINRLSLTNAGVVACLPTIHDLLCINDKGEVEWRLPRIWELQRWNTGPSSGIWGIDRFGIEVEEGVTAGTRGGIDPKVAEAERKAAQEQIDKLVRAQRATRLERSERFYKDYKAWIAAGPVRVRALDDDLDSDRLFVAVGKARFPSNLVAAPECVIYEVRAAGGWIEAVAPLPRMVYPRMPISLRGASVWTCEGGSLARIGVGDPEDLQCPIDWYRDYLDVARNRDGWDSEGPGSNTKVTCATAAKLFRAGFRYERGDQAVTLRINAVDLETGLARDLVLTLPFEGKIPDRDDDPAGDGECTQGFSPREFRVAIDVLEIEGDTLRVVVRIGRLQSALEFDVKALFAKPAAD